jgi:transcriptional regulator with XRE-family HTH domain
MANKAAAKPAASRGRPSKYKDEFPEQARKLCLLGATDKDLARFFGVTESTLNEWKRGHPDLSESLKAGKELADAVVAESLFHRAKGYSHKAVKIMVVDKVVVHEEYTEHYPPDPTSMIFWLKNRRPDLWRDKPDPSADEAPVLPVKVVVQVEDASQPEAE